MIVRNARIALNAAASDPLTIPDGHALVRIEIPAAMTSTVLKLQVSVDKGATHRASFNNTEFTQTIAPSQSHAISSNLTFGANSVILSLNANEALERSVPCVFERVNA